MYQVEVVTFEFGQSQFLVSVSVLAGSGVPCCWTLKN